MQTMTEHLTQDFETHPAGTGKELARLSDRVQELETAIYTAMQLQATATDMLLATTK
jgi:hypothetical protein